MDDWRARADALAGELTAGTTASSPAARLLELKKDASLLHDTLPAYERRRQSDIISGLEASLKKIQPPPTTSSSSRFAFSRVRKQPDSQPNSPIHTDINNPPASSVNSPIDSRSSDSVENVHPDKEIPEAYRTAEYISLSDVLGNDKSTSVSLAGLDKCTLDLRCPEEGNDHQPSESITTIPALYLENIKHCLVIAPNITGSVLIHNAEDCVFVLKCHQFRMHTSTRNKVLLDTDSTPIIEKCKGIKFGTHDNDKALDVLDFDAPNPGQAQNWSVMASDENQNLRTRLKALPVGSSARPEGVTTMLKHFGII